MGIVFGAIARTKFDSASLTGSYAALNGSGTTDTCRMIKMYNASNVDVDISYNGTTDHDFLPVGGTMILDLQTNSDKTSGGDGKYVMKKSQIIYGKGSAGTGYIYIIGYK